MIIAKLKLLDEMPKTCAYCPYALHSIGFISCDLVRVKGDIRTKLYGDITKRPDGCPLAEVNPCDICEVAKYHNLEDDDSPCLNCGEEE